MASVEVNGAALEYIERGNGTPIVFVHGAASDHRTWHGQLSAFGDSFRAISYSRRYHWPNEPIADGSSYALDEQVDDLAHLLRPAASHDILHSKRCYCNALKTRGVSEPLSVLKIRPPSLGLENRGIGP